MALAASTFLPAVRRAAGALPIWARVIGGFALLLAVLITLLATSILWSRQHRDAMEQGALSELIHDTYREAERQATVANLLLARFVTGSDEEPLAVRANIASVSEKLTEARSLEVLRGEQDLADVEEAEELAALDELLLAASALSDSSEQVITLRTSGDVAGAQQALESVTDGFFSLESSIAVAAELERQEVVEYQGRAMRSNSRIEVLQIMAVIAGITVTIIMATAVTRSILRPLNALGKTARAIAAGDLKAEASSEGPSELAELGTDLNLMKNELLNLTRKQALVDALRESEKKFGTLAETTDASIVIYRDSEILYSNKAFVLLTGFAPEEVGSMSLPDVLHGESKQDVIDGTARLQRGDDSSFESEVAFVARDGELRWVDFRAVPMEYDGQPALLGTAIDITDRKLAESEARNSRLVKEAILESATDGIITIDTGGIVQSFNGAAVRMFGYSAEEVVGRNVTQLMPSSERKKHEGQLSAYLRGGESRVTGALTKVVGRRKDGSTFPMELMVSEMRIDDVRLFTGVARDVSEIVVQENRLTKLSQALEQSSGIVVITDTEGNVEYVNSKFTEVTGYAAEEVIGENPRMFQSGETPRSVYKELWATITSGESWTGEIHNRKKNGDSYWVSAMISPVKGPDGKVTNYVGIQEDVTARKRAEKTMRHMAFHDALTGLPNRALLQDRLDVALAQARRGRGKISVMFLDIDRFKLVNDTAGHAQGDELLRGAARRLEGIVRDGDTVARVGGDEFAILLPSIDRASDAADLAQRILEAFREPWVLDGRDVVATVSVGVCLYPDDGDEAETLLRNADTAMYRAKEFGNQFQLYTSKMNDTIVDRMALEDDLRHAVERDEFVLYYQPQTDVRTGEIVGAEALIRWQHPSRGLVLPGDFIGLAEESDLIWALDEWALHAACAQNKAWQDAGLPPITMAVNLSARHIETEGLATWISRALAESGLDPRHLELEITETAAMADAERSVAVLTDLRALGVKIAVDDFGTGYSSLSYLKRLPVTTVKIDRSFVSDLDADDHSRAIVSAIVTLAHSLGFDVIAEGVEAKEQLALLRMYGCEIYQGFFFSKPWPAAAFEEILRGQRSASRSAISSPEAAR